MFKLDQIVEQSNGKFVSVIFTKKDGTERKLTGRLGVTKHLKGGTCTIDKSKYLIVYDTVNEGYRAINRETIKSVSIEGVRIFKGL